MKWKMAENSLFAILLRAPWWASGGISLALIGLSFALLPTTYVIFGLAAAIPFVVIAVMVLWRLAKRPRAAAVEATAERVRAMNAKAFGADLTRAFEQAGHAVEPGRGGSADLLVTQGWRVQVLSYRKWKAAHIGIEPLRALEQAREEAEAQGAVFITLGQLSQQAAAYAQKHSIQVLGAEGLAVLLGKPEAS